jgi:hypothetical protein
LLGAIAMRRALAIAFACGFLMSAASPGLAAADELASAPLAPETEDARAGMCDAFDGLAFTFCVALCEARACDTLDVDDGRCELLRRGFADVSRGTAPPCAGVSA